jgi:hypothetical protein
MVIIIQNLGPNHFPVNEERCGPGFILTDFDRPVRPILKVELYAARYRKQLAFHNS